ncbi:hypothetical protein LR48_Vigan04g118800 [Vigna angularis]|uniref:Ubiquitin-like protease family profile domain-containing protein n=1 Tax=Phaseolus angularis TaxID=3914 RepID=A0A0L9UDK9_PHAAN|nr:hypothetical protein LR48_Vigan04g118800 [Vigna angularis]
MRKSNGLLGLESPDLAPSPARHELWKVARTKSNGQMTSQSAREISQRIFYHPKKQLMAQPVNEAYEEAEDDEDPLSILTSRLNMLRKGPIELLWELITFGLEFHIPLYIDFNDALEIIGGETILNFSCIQLWCMKMKSEFKSLLQIVVARTRGQQIEIIYPKCNKQNDSWACGYYIMSWMKAIIPAEIREDWTERCNTTSTLSDVVIKKIREEWAKYLNKHFK